MLETEENEGKTDSLTQQLRRVIKDGVDYAASVFELVQARAVELALSGLVFAVLLAFGVLVAFTAFILLMVALGFWITSLTGSAGWTLLIMGSFLCLVSALAVWRALAWLRNLKS